MSKSVISEKDLLRAKILSNTMFATRFMFKHRFGRKFIVGNHHEQIAEVLDQVYSGKIKRLIINLPPRYSKTEEAVKTFIAKGLAINPRSKFIHLSYSNELALDNSSETKDIVQSDWYRELFPDVKIEQGANAKHKWYTTAGGGVYATSSAGQVTGFGAGEVEEERELLEEIDSIEQAPIFSGAIIIDDPIKPEDASSSQIRGKVNMRFETTIRSRTNSRNTPIIIIMQRLHREDLCGYLLETEPEEWTVLSLQALTTDRDGIETALWPFKHTVEELHKLKSANKFVFETQYQQNPKEINEKLWAFAFSREKHCATVTWKPEEITYLSFDFNRNPMTCFVAQHYDGAVKGIELISIDNSTTKTVCKYVEENYPGTFFMVTGDVSGKSSTTVSYLDNYGIIKNHFNLAKSQMQYSGANPRLEDSRYFINSILEEYDIKIDPVKCKLLVFDLENVLADSENKILKGSRDDKTKRADSLDTFRYYLHRYFKYFEKIS